MDSLALSETMRLHLSLAHSRGHFHLSRSLPELNIWLQILHHSLELRVDRFAVTPEMSRPVAIGPAAVPIERAGWHPFLISVYTLMCSLGTRAKPLAT
jgi:hypothetical protein